MPARSDALTATGNVVETRAWHTATLRASGKMLLVGGLDPYAINNGSVDPKKTADIYNPTTA